MTILLLPMAIGSEGEIGTEFGMWKDMTEQQREAWFEHMRTHWKPNLLNGYATIHYTLRRPNERQL
jgi:hypothetical protein